MFSCHSILECCVIFSGVKLSIISSVLFRASFQIHSCFMSQWIAIVTSVNSIEVN